MKHKSFISFSKLAIIRKTSSFFTRRFLKIFSKKSIVKNNELNMSISLVMKKIANVKKTANATMTKKKKKFNKIMKVIITSTMRTSTMNENNKKIANEIAKNITITIKETLNQKKDAINANVIMLTLNAIVAMKRIMNDVAARNHASHKKIITIFATTAIIAATIKINKFLNCL